MAPADPSRRRATAADLLSLPGGRAAEIVGGEIVDKALPSFEHGSAQSGLSGALFGFRGPPGGGTSGPGGCWLATEVEVEYESHEVYPHYWLLDPDGGTLRVLRWTADGYLEALSATADETVRAEPFEAVALVLRDVFGLT
jgi:hypothetical protein